MNTDMIAPIKNAVLDLKRIGRNEFKLYLWRMQRETGDRLIKFEIDIPHQGICKPNSERSDQTATAIIHLRSKVFDGAKKLLRRLEYRAAVIG